MTARRHAQVRTFARKFVSTHDRPPSRTEIAKALDIAPNGHLSRIMNDLRARGDIPAGKRAGLLASAVDRSTAALDAHIGSSVTIDRADLELILNAIPERLMI